MYMVTIIYIPKYAYDVTLGSLLANVYHLTRIEYGIDQLEELCIKVFTPKRNIRIPTLEKYGFSITEIL